MRNTKTTKRIWMAALALVLTGALGACSDQPMAPEEGYEVQLDGNEGKNCIIIDGVIHCNG